MSHLRSSTEPSEHIMPNLPHAAENSADKSRNNRLHALVGDHGRSVDRLLRTLERDPATREELWSDVFTVANEHLDELDGLAAGQARRWLLTTARHLTSNAARRASTRRRTVERFSREPLTLAPSAEDAYFDAQPDDAGRSEHLKAAWLELSVPHQQILVLDALGSNGKAIAKQLGITHQGARSRLMRARKAFLVAYQTSGEPTA